MGNLCFLPAEACLLQGQGFSYFLFIYSTVLSKLHKKGHDKWFCEWKLKANSCPCLMCGCVELEVDLCSTVCLSHPIVPSMYPSTGSPLLVLLLQDSKDPFKQVIQKIRSKFQVMLSTTNPNSSLVHQKALPPWAGTFCRAGTIIQKVYLTSK